MIRPKVTTRVKNFIDLDKIMRQIKDSYVTVGIHEGAGQYTNNDGTQGPTVVEVGFWNEYGTTNSPERSFMRSSIDEHIDDINKWRVELIERIIFKKMPVERALKALGLRIQLLIQNKIKSNVPPALAPSTAAAKTRDGKAAVTLIDSGLLLRSITHQVHMGNSK